MEDQLTMRFSVEPLIVRKDELDKAEDVRVSSLCGIKMVLIWVEAASVRHCSHAYAFSACPAA